MPSYALSRTADSDLAAIYIYTFHEFGERQADTYFASLESCFAMIGDHPKVGVDVGWIRSGYRRFIHKQHAIYYRAAARPVLIVRILGPGMGPDDRLP